MDNASFVDDQNEKNIGLHGNFKTEKVKAQTELPQYAHTFDEAITLAGCGKFQYKLLVICGLCFLTVMVQIICISVILPSVKCDLPATLSEQGMLASAGFFGLVLSSHAMGFLADTWGRNQVLRWSVILSTITSLISAFSVDIWMLIVFRFLTGFFISGCQACVFSYCGEFHGDKTRVKHVTLLSVFLPIALSYIPAVAMFVLPLQIDIALFGMLLSPWRWLLMSNTVISVAAVIGLYMLPETPKLALALRDQKGAMKIFREIFTTNTGRPGDEYPVSYVIMDDNGANIADIHGFKDAIKMVWGQTLPLFYKERILQTLNISFILFVVYGMSHGLFMWYPTILTDLIRRDGENVCKIISEVNVLADSSSEVCNGNVDSFGFIVLILIGAAFTAIYLIFAFIIDIVGKKNLLLAFLILCIICSVWIHWVSELAVAVIVLTLIMAVGNCGGIVSTISVEYYPTSVSAMAMCFVMMVGRLGAVVGSNIIGRFLFDYCDNVFYIISGIMLVICFLGWLLPEKKRPKTFSKEIK